jgi:hypothetical protein
VRRVLPLGGLVRGGCQSAQVFAGEVREADLLRRVLADPGAVFAVGGRFVFVGEVVVVLGVFLLV